MMNKERASWQPQTYSSGPSSLTLASSLLADVVLRTSRNLSVSFLPSLCFKTKSSRHIVCLSPPPSNDATCPGTHHWSSRRLSWLHALLPIGHVNVLLCHLEPSHCFILLVSQKMKQNASYTNKQLISDLSHPLIWVFNTVPAYFITYCLCTPRDQELVFSSSLWKRPEPGLSKRLPKQLIVVALVYSP